MMTNPVACAPGSSIGESKNPVLVKYVGRRRAGADFVAHDVLGADLLPCPADRLGFGVARHDDAAVLVRDDQIARREEHTGDLDRHVEVDDALASEAVVNRAASS